MKFALVVGHEEKSPGAHATDPLNCYEYEYNKELAAMVSCDLKDLSIISEIFFRDQIGIHGVYTEVNRYLPQGVIELHFNSSGLSSVRGTETLYVPRVEGSHSLAINVHECILHALSRPKDLDRGLVIPNVIDRGYSNLTLAQCPSILVEPFFGDNPQDARLGKFEKSALSQAIAEGIQRFLLGVK